VQERKLGAPLVVCFNYAAFLRNAPCPRVTYKLQRCLQWKCAATSPAPAEMPSVSGWGTQGRSHGPRLWPALIASPQEISATAKPFVAACLNYGSTGAPDIASTRDGSESLRVVALCRRHANPVVRHKACFHISKITAKGDHEAPSQHLPRRSHHSRTAQKSVVRCRIPASGLRG